MRGLYISIYMCVYLVYVCLLRDVFVSYDQFVLLIDEGDLGYVYCAVCRS